VDFFTLPISLPIQESRPFSDRTSRLARPAVISLTRLSHELPQPTPLCVAVSRNWLVE
jgi:hypothetical protein